MYNSRSPTSRTAGDFPTSPYHERRSPLETLSPAQRDEFTFAEQSSSSQYEVRSPTSPYSVRSPVSPYDVRSPTSPYDRRSPVSPYDMRAPLSPNDNGFPPSSGKGRSLSSSSAGSCASTGLSGIQAHLSSPSQLPRVSDYQLKSLEANFKDNRNPSELDLTLISAEVGLPESEVKHWFSHRLARWRLHQGLPANSTSICD
ncbi:hypothetical protein EGW08_021448 [Elysia chlorotica]|uniref:Homeodomain-only protein n=1 Tax=Elysia chlorotica TaxID=188477 RepID=A0A433SNG9_ELYCH|nr:hypothetical protein EGW08_021448 [Elysia chlorotica]